MCLQYPGYTAQNSYQDYNDLRAYRFERLLIYMRFGRLSYIVHVYSFNCLKKNPKKYQFRYSCIFLQKYLKYREVDEFEKEGGLFVFFYFDLYYAIFFQSGLFIHFCVSLHAGHGFSWFPLFMNRIISVTDTGTF